MEDTTELIDPPVFARPLIEQLVGTRIKNVDIYRKAFTHKSALKKYKLTESFETLEFMGDSVLGFIITKMLFDQYESKQEGFLTKARTKLVRGATLAQIAKKMGLTDWILMDDKGIRNGWNHNEKILEDVFEALVGAIYMDIGFIHAREFVLSIFKNPAFVNMDCIMVDDNFKDQLMRYCQMNRFELPLYNCVTGEDNTFYVNIFIQNIEFGRGTGKTKKQAEQNAAYNSLLNIQNYNNVQ